LVIFFVCCVSALPFFLTAKRQWRLAALTASDSFFQRLHTKRVMPLHANAFAPLQDSNRQLEQTTGKLQEEKLRLDALLVRQYNLIAVLGNPRRRACRDVDDGGGTPDSSIGDAPEGLTLGECVGGLGLWVYVWGLGFSFKCVGLLL
jgi:hypothetical protein